MIPLVVVLHTFKYCNKGARAHACTHMRARTCVRVSVYTISYIRSALQYLTFCSNGKDSLIFSMTYSMCLTMHRGC